MELEEAGTIGPLSQRRILQGADSIAVTAGQLLKIETSPGGGEILDTAVPAGKTWQVEIQITVIETDA
jgi:hypothetical protein